MSTQLCSECCKSIRGGPSKMKIHMRKHTGEKPYKCQFEDCRWKFADPAALLRHSRVHSGERHFKCTIEGCGMAFAQSGTLVDHVRSHNQDKPYKCTYEQCSASFSQSGDFNAHIRTHLRSNMFLCPYKDCIASFATSSNLNAHIRTHTGEQPHICDFYECQAAFAQLSNLKRHKECYHSEEGVQRKKKQEEAMKNALITGNYVQSFERGRVPPPGQFCREVYFDHRCALARNFMPGERKYAYVDFVVTSPDGRVVFLEVDEEQHVYQPQLCETVRMWNICESIALADLGADINVFWLRINPNSGFRVEGKTLPTTREKRLSEVVKFLDNLKSNPSDPPMQIGYAFYDCDINGKPIVLNDTDFHPDVAKAVVCISKGTQSLTQPEEFLSVNPMFAPLDLAPDHEEIAPEGPME